MTWKSENTKEKIRSIRLSQIENDEIEAFLAKYNERETQGYYWNMFQFGKLVRRAVKDFMKLYTEKWDGEDKARAEFDKKRKKT